MPMLGGDTIYLDSTDKEVKGLKIGDTVTVTIKGTVKELEASRSYKYDGEEEKVPARLGVQVKSQKLNGKPNAFSRMAADDLAETED